MHDNLFYRLGLKTYQFKLIIIIFWSIIVLSCIPSLPQIMTPFQSTGFVDDHSMGAMADQYLNKKLNFNHNQLILLYHSKVFKANGVEFSKQIKQSLVGLKNLHLKHKLVTPQENPNQISSDKHSAYVVLSFENKKPITPELFATIKKNIKIPTQLTLKIGGESVFLDSVNKQTQTDLKKADLIAAPISIIILIFVFGSVVAAIIPVLLGGGAAVIILNILYWIGHATSLSIFTINIALLLGICLSLDYSLFIISRFREELIRQDNVCDAIAVTMSSAGKAVFFSGLAVFVSLSALLLFPVNILYSIGIGGLTAVFAAVIVALVVLPASLAILNTRINSWPVRFFIMNKHSKANIWKKIASTVVKKPGFFFIVSLSVLLLLGTPFYHAKFGVSDEHMLPKQSESRQFFDAYSLAFNQHELTPITLIITSHHGNILSSDHIAKLYDLSKKIKSYRGIKSISSIVNINPNLSKKQYQMLYSPKNKITDPKIITFLKSTTTTHLSVIRIVSQYENNSADIKLLIQQLRQLNPGYGLSLQVTGTSVINDDVLNSISRVFPYAIMWIMVLTYFILLVLLRSLFLPFKAILMNVLSLCATYGVLVFIFQEGHLHQLLHFEPQGILDISLLVIIFCALFGFSMDYEVFLLSRIHEHYLKTKQNTESIVFGIEHSSRIITSAAIIVIVTCASFMVADILVVKEFGLGIAVAIFVDAFIVRTIFVPATMALVKQLNWYLPKWLDKII